LLLSSAGPSFAQNIASFQQSAAGAVVVPVAAVLHLQDAGGIAGTQTSFLGTRSLLSQVQLPSALIPVGRSSERIVPIRSGSSVVVKQSLTLPNQSRKPFATEQMQVQPEKGSSVFAVPRFLGEMGKSFSEEDASSSRQAGSELSSDNLFDGRRAIGGDEPVVSESAEKTPGAGSDLASAGVVEEQQAESGPIPEPVGMQAQPETLPLDAAKTSSQAKPVEKAKVGVFERIRSLPASFLWGFTPAWTLNGVSQELQAVAVPLFTAGLFGLPAALAVTGAGFLMRIAGAWTGSFFMKRFNPKWVNFAAVAAVALAGMTIPLAAAFHASSGLMLSALLFNSVVEGTAYGVNRGVAENLLARMIIGSEDPAKFELGMNYAYQWVELGCIGTALFLAVPMLNLFGGPALMWLSCGVMAFSAAVYMSLKFREPWQKPALESAQEKSSSLSSVFGLGDYLPYMFFRFMHFMMYGVMATVLALGVFANPAAAGTVIGLYDGGSWLAGMLATLALLPEKSLGRKGWAVLAGVAAAAFMASTFLAIPILSYVLSGILGGVITINSNKWMGYYAQRLTQAQQGDLSKWMMTASILAMLPLFLAVSAARLFPAVAAILSMTNILIAATVFVTALAVLMTAMMFKKSGIKG
jgi:hypothetical protein